MNAVYENFIGIYENAYPREFCIDAINYYEDMVSKGFGYSRQQLEGISKTIKDDTSVCASDENSMKIDYTSQLQPSFLNLFWSQYYVDYQNQFEILNNNVPKAIFALKIQKTLIGQGYHNWHSENSNRHVQNRILTYTLYLNDVEEGGETEFLYYPKRVKPKVGTLVIFPAGFAHTHRGNPPLSNEKYIITGWVEV